MVVMDGKNLREGGTILAFEFIGRIKTFALILLLYLVIYASSTALAAGSLSTRAEAETPTCTDTPAPDPVLQFETLPVHVQLAEYLIGSSRMAEYLPGYGRPNHFSCQSAHFKYEAFRDDEKISIVSSYKKSGQIHAEYVAVKNDNISARYQKHGVITAFWPNGKKQFEEYYVDGFAVGFHRYFDEAERLIYVADYSASDYEFNKRFGAGEFRQFYQGKSTWGNAPLSKKTQLFRTVYAIENDQAVLKAFATAGLFFPSWIELDLNSTVAQWTTPGNQGKVSIDNRVYEVVNGELDYMPFFEVYLRHKLSLQEAREPKPINQELLDSPWIDQAMRLGLEDERFKLKPAAYANSVENVAVPQNRYTKCRTQPNVECLFEQVAENLQFESSHRDTYRNGFAFATLAVGYPEWAKKIMKANLSEINSNANPYTWLAEPTSILAMAEWTLGLNTEAQRSATQAFNIAFRKRTGSPRATYLSAMESVLPLFLAGDSPVSVDKAMSYFNFAKTEQVPNAFRILENAAIAQARHGNIQEAWRLADALSTEANSGAVSLSSLRTFKDKQPGLHTSVMLALAEGRLDRGDAAAAREALGELEQGEPYFLQDATLAARAGILYARLGEVEKAIGAIKKFNWYIPSGTDDIAIALCKANEVQVGKTLARNMAEFEKNGKTKKISVGTQAKLAKIEFFCGNPKKAKVELTQALSDMYQFRCHSDFCDYDGLVNGVKLAFLEIGWLEPIWQRDQFDDGVMNLKIAVQRAEQGDVPAALARLDDLAVKSPRNNGGGYPLLYALARAQVLAALGRNSEVENELTKARSIAVNYDNNRSRARGLLEVAETLLKLKQSDKAKAYAKEVAYELANNMSTGQGQFVYSTPGDEGIVKLFAQTGVDADALETAWSFLEPDRHGQLAVQKQAHQKVLAEIALAQFKQEPNTQLLDAISKIQSLSYRLNNWRQALTIAASLQNDEGQEFIKSALRGEMQNLQDSLNVGMKPSDRRQAIHSIATLLQADTQVLDEAQKLKTIETLAESARAMTENQFGAKALCELAYTAHAIQQPSLASAWFEEAKNRAAKYHSHTFPIDESPLGACAYWAKTAGDKETANTMVAELLNSLPENLDNIHSQIHTLLNVAIAYAEYEKGEIFWAEYGK